MPDEAFRVVGTRTAGEFGFLRVDEIDVATPAGHGRRFAVRHPGAVAVVATHAGNVLLFRQFRAPVARFLLEIPAGKLDVPGEPPEVTAARELEEEIGYRPGSMTRIGEFFTAPGFTDEHMTLYHASDLERGVSHPHGPEEEAGEVVAIPIDDIPALISSGEVVDAKTLVGLQWLLLHEA